VRTTARHCRNDRIVALRARGLTIRKIAEEVGVSERHCARILDERKQGARSSPSQPAQSTSPPNSTATELLDRLQGTVGDLAAIARERSDRYSVGQSIRVEVMLRLAEGDIAELRRRSALFTPVDPVAEGGSPPSGPDMS
jgi:AraC-like DNA-binding protein